jgi:hypothetical protein
MALDAAPPVRRARGSARSPTNDQNALAHEDFPVKQTAYQAESR